ncbi:MAG: LLM class F420-dependent oxidoreductase [Pseudonocardiaceae bacterium]
MEFGLTMFPTHDAIDPASLGRAAEERGFELLLFPEHTHIPTSRRSPYPGGGELPRRYIHTYDPFVALSAVATATSRLRLGTGVCLLIERDPIITAKEVASIDHLSGGRFLFGVGAGWNREEMANHGTDPTTRMALLGERVKAMKEIWTREEAEFHGRHVDFDPIWSWPKPAQRPHPPVLVGGMGPTVLDRVVEFGDEWLAQNVTADNVDEFAGRATELRRRARDAGRDEIPISLFAARPEPEMIERYAGAGISRCVFLLPSRGADEVLPRMDRHAELMSQV